MPIFVKDQLHYVENTMGRIRNSIYQSVQELSIAAWRTKEPVPYEHRCAGEELRLHKGDPWGELFDCAWFHFTGDMPAALPAGTPCLLLDMGGELCVFNADGCPVRGLTNVRSEFELTLGAPGKIVYELPQEMLEAGRIDVWADAGNNDLFGKQQNGGRIERAELAVRCEEMKGLYYDCFILLELSRQVDPESARGPQVLHALMRACDCMLRYTPWEAVRAREILAPALAMRGGDPSFRVSAIGHAHIDLAWLWPLRETVRKGARTFSTVLANMETYPDYRFGASQPQLYQWMKQYYPALYEKIHAAIRSGRFEVQGAMWVEADTNITGEESLVRQFLYGKRFFKEEFGTDIEVLWLPDVFGYSAALPQLMRKSGVPYFMTQKLSWNIHNRHPHHTFLWQGIDGSEVLAHMLPEENYNSPASPRAIRKAEANFADKAVCDEALILFGIGDGGGGPGEEHLEALQREKNLAGIAPVRQEPSIDFFRRQEKRRGDLQRFSGELYLERHQGTYTSQARNKQHNCQMEALLHQAELLCSMALTQGAAYPLQELDELWKEVLLYQFHDILPGSSIARVYEETEERYRILEEQVNALIHKTAALLGPARAEACAVYNPLSWERTEWLSGVDGWQRVTAAPLSFALLTRAEGSYTAVTGNDFIENELLRAEFTADGALSSVFDKRSGQPLLSGAANELRVYLDSCSDAWDMEPLYDRKHERFTLTDRRAYTDGPRAVMELTYRYGASTLTQKVVLTSASPRLDFITDIDWQESGCMLRAHFPLAVWTTEAACGIQFGSVRRPTHKNTTWDLAKSEVCAQRWVDLSQRDHGVSLLCPDKYGYAFNGSTVSLNLLRSSEYPGVGADRGLHAFTYALYPHLGDSVAGETVREAYALCEPLTLFGGVEPEQSAPLLKIEGTGVLVSAVKKAQDRQGLIVRLYECDGAAVTASLCARFAVREAFLCNLLEEPQTPADLQRLSFSPYEIITLLLNL